MMKNMTYTQLFKRSLIASLLILAVSVNQEDVLDLMFGKPGQEITVVMMTDNNTLPQEDTDDEVQQEDRAPQENEDTAGAEADPFGPWQPRRWSGHGNESGSMR